MARHTRSIRDSYGRPRFLALQSRREGYTRPRNKTNYVHFGPLSLLPLSKCLIARNTYLSPGNISICLLSLLQFGDCIRILPEIHDGRTWKLKGPRPIGKAVALPVAVQIQQTPCDEIPPPATEIITHLFVFFCEFFAFPECLLELQLQQKQTKP